MTMSRCKACNGVLSAYEAKGQQQYGEVCIVCYVPTGEFERHPTISGTPQAVFSEYVSDNDIQFNDGLGLMSQDKLYSQLYNSAFNRFIDYLQGGITPLRALELALLQKVNKSINT